MSKTSSLDLFSLIKSLNKNEKGYVKKFSFSRKDSDAHFIRLFDAIDKQEKYSEEALKKEKYVRQLPRLKIYLYEHILAALDSYYSKKNIDILLRKTLSRVYILFEKGLYDQCIKQLFKAKELAIKYEKFTQLLEVHGWERTLMMERLLIADFLKVSKEEEETIEQIKNLSLYKKFYEQVSKLYAETIYIRNEKENRLFTKIIYQPAFKEVSRATSLQAKIFFLKTLTKYYAAIDDRKKYLHFSSYAVSLIEEHPDFISQNVMQYIKLLNNLLATLSEHGKKGEYEKYLDRLKKIPSQHPQANTEKTKSIIVIRVAIRNYFNAVNNKNFDESLLAINEIEKILIKHQALISETHRTMFLYQVAYMYFIHGYYKTALAWVNIILISPLTSDKLFFHCFARLMSMIIHLELSNIDVLESQYRSNIRFFAKHKKTYMLESIVLNFILAYLQSLPSNGEFDNLLKEFKKRLETKLPALESKLLEYFDFISWIESKLRKRLMKEIIPSKTVS